VAGVSLRIPCGEEAQSEARARILLTSVWMRSNVEKKVKWSGIYFEGGDASVWGVRMLACFSASKPTTIAADKPGSRALPGKSVSMLLHKCVL
jgi:hypothetical protein